MGTAAEVIRRFDLAEMTAPFTRCMRCNGLLDRVEKAEIEHRLLPKTRRYYDEFAVCRDCGRVYWKGSHYEDMQRGLDRLLGTSVDPGAQSQAAPASARSVHQASSPR